jgi:hypothetical protein
MASESIIDSSRPNAGRIYDCLLGGNHNFEVDREAAEAIQKLMPYIPKAMRLQRWCLQDIAVELTEKRGYDVIIDFASGLPTNDHLHHVVPPGTTVIYSDCDPITVEYAKDILKDVPQVYYFLADARRPEEFLNHQEVQAILQNRRDVALVHWGISLFMTDEEMSHVARALDDWSGPKSCWVFNGQGESSGVADPRAIQVTKMYERMGTPLYIRTVEEYGQLVRPWHPDERGFVSFLEWHGIDFDQLGMTPEDREIVGATGGGFGVYLYK